LGDGGGGSYAGTSLPDLWQGFASAALASLTLSYSCYNKLVTCGCCTLCAPLFLAMVVEMKKHEASQSPMSVEWSFNFRWMWTNHQFFPSLRFLSARGKLQSGWQLRRGCTPARSADFLLVARDLIPLRDLGSPDRGGVVDLLHLSDHRGGGHIGKLRSLRLCRSAEQWFWKMVVLATSYLWRVHQRGTHAGVSALPPISMVDRRPSSRSSTSSGGLLQLCVGDRHHFFSKWFVPGGVGQCD
jgi:hypothetical protein